MRVFKTVSSIGCAALCALAQAQYTYAVVADNSGAFSDFSSQFGPAISNTGHVAYYALHVNPNGEGLYLWDGSTSTPVDTDSVTGDVNGPGAYFEINSYDHIVFQTRHNFGQPTIYLWTPLGGSVYQTSTDIGTNFAALSDPCLNDHDVIGFHGTSRSPSALGVFRGNATLGWTTIDSNRTYLQNDPVNNSNVVAFVAKVTGPVVYTVNRSDLGPLATQTGGAGYGQLVSMNDAGSVAYLELLATHSQILVHNGTSPSVVADTASGYSTLTTPSINNHGNIAFSGSAGGHFGIYTGSNPNAGRVVQTGDAMFGSTLSSLTVFGSKGLNDRGEVVFAGRLANGKRLIIKATPVAVTITGSVDLLDWGGSSSVVDFELIGPGGQAYPGVVLGAAGAYSFQTTLRGTYDIYAKGSHWLRHKVASVTVTSGGVSGLNYTLENGDVDGDNEVAIGDYAQLSAAFNASPGDGNWSENADLNGDLTVDIGDYAILSGSFGLNGE